VDRYRVGAGDRVDLTRWDPRDEVAFGEGKARGKQEVKRLTRRLEELQELLWADGSQRLLVVLQGMDTSGKDGTIRHVFDGVNPQGVRVAGFKAPTVDELARDYLWRVHRHVPARGEIAIFNRSHYEDVLIVRVRALVPEAVWSRRFDHINGFERMLADEGVTIRKFFLHISRDEQKERLQARLDEPDKRWKFSRGDLVVRSRWDDYRQAYEGVLSRTSTDWAPWYIVPADRKWYRNLVVSTVLVETLTALDPQPPQPEEDLDDIVIE
jgi:PPK2 family polyphosphate:nucleotide phosphotransferase